MAERPLREKDNALLVSSYAVSLTKMFETSLMGAINMYKINMYKILENRENRLNFHQRMFIGSSWRGGRVVEGAPLLRE